jgi:membrane-bound ClpP family serine protease
MGRLDWLLALMEPYFLMALVLAAGLPWLLLPGVVGMLVGAALAAGLFWLDHRLTGSVASLPVRVGAEAMVGERVVVLERLDPTGVVGFAGERWRATEVGGRQIERGGVARVVRVEGLVLEVEGLAE